MKYSYFCAGKGGKLHARNNFLYNNKTHGFLSCSAPTYYASVTRRSGVCDWYWEQAGELKTYHHIESNSMINDMRYNEVWFPTTGTMKQYLKSINLPILDHCPVTCCGVFSNCFDVILSQDMITNPLLMMGYGGVLGGNKLLKAIECRSPTFTGVPIDHIVKELRKRKNIIAYKSDIRHMAHNFFVGSGRPLYKHPDVLVTQTDEGYIKECTKRINRNREYPKAIASLLDDYDIPYEMFDLDNADYKKTFDLEDSLPISTDPTPTLDEYVTDKDIVEGWIDDYVHLFQ